MTNWADKRAAAQRELVLAQEIVGRHFEEECVDVWTSYLAKIGSKRAGFYRSMRKALPIQMAELLEPGELAKMMDEPKG